MTNVQRRAAQLLVLHPDWTDAMVCRDLNKSAAWLCRLKQHEDFKAYLKELLDQAWEDAGVEARKVMIDLLKDPKSEVAFKASQFILQTTGLNPVQKIDAEVTNKVINVTIEEDD